MQTILILEDHPDLRAVYTEVLGPAYKLTEISSLSEFKDYLSRPDLSEPHLFIADLHLPDGSLMDLTRTDDWFRRFRDWPTIVVSAIDDVSTLESCYTSGVLDYLTKPFNRNELLVKCRRVLERSAQRPFAFSPVTMTVTMEGKASERLTAQESKIFHFLAASWGAGVTKQRLMEAVWSEAKPSKKLDVHVSRLRKKLQPVGLSIDFRMPDRLSLRASVKAPTTSGLPS